MKSGQMRAGLHTQMHTETSLILTGQRPPFAPRPMPLAMPVLFCSLKVTLWATERTPCKGKTQAPRHDLSLWVGGSGPWDSRKCCACQNEGGQEEAPLPRSLHQLKDTRPRLYLISSSCNKAKLGRHRPPCFKEGMRPWAKNSYFLETNLPFCLCSHKDNVVWKIGREGDSGRQERVSPDMRGWGCPDAGKEMSSQRNGGGVLVGKLNHQNHDPHTWE